MPIPKAVARFNRVALNRVTRPLAHRLPGMGVVVHRGRRSGRLFRTPVNVFRSGAGYRIALTYGTDVDWVKNVLDAGGCELETRGRLIRLVAPHLYHDDQRRHMPVVVRLILRALGVADFLTLERAG